MSRLSEWLAANMPDPMDIPLEARFTVQGRTHTELSDAASKVLLGLHDDSDYTVSFGITARPLTTLAATGDVQTWEGDVYAVFRSKHDPGDPGPIGTESKR